MNRTCLRIIYLLPLLVLAGCASQYDCYPCGKVSCNYCPLKAMPYSEFQSCNCNDSIGQAYLASLPNNAGLSSESEVPIDSYYLDDSSDQPSEPEKATNGVRETPSEGQ